jgi:hypothetical protein
MMHVDLFECLLLFWSFSIRVAGRNELCAPTLVFFFLSIALSFSRLNSLVFSFLIDCANRLEGQGDEYH